MAKRKKVEEKEPAAPKPAELAAEWVERQSAAAELLETPKLRRGIPVLPVVDPDD